MEFNLFFQQARNKGLKKRRPDIKLIDGQLLKLGMLQKIVDEIQAFTKSTLEKKVCEGF
jgi:hypothetical protein